MKKPVEKILRKGVYTFGTCLESLIERFKKLKSGVSKRGLQPILSLESQLEEKNIKQLILHGVKGLVEQSIPSLKDRNTLEMADGEAAFSPNFMRSGANLSIFCEIGDSIPPQGDSGSGFIIKADPSGLPFEGSSFDYFIAQLTTPLQGDLVKVASELGRILIPGGQGVIIDFHPYSLFAKDGPQRMRSLKSVVRGVEDYYNICRKAGLRIVNVKEAFVDELSRQFFLPDSIQVYRNLKGTPLLIAIFIYKPKGKVA